MANLKIISLQFLLTFLQVASQESTGFSLQLIPWDSPNSPLFQPNLTQAQKVQIMAISSKARALAGKTFDTNAIQIPMKQQDLRYAVKIKIGKQLTEVTLLLDTGSAAIWTHCSKSGFNPAKSKTYKALPCQNPLCKMAKDMCKCINNHCVCNLRYGIEGGKTMVEAVLSSDSFTLPSKKTYNNMIFGCSNKLSPIYSGILGLNKSPVSLISQVKQSVKGCYSYCLYSGGGYLRFGDNIPRVGKDAKTTKILHPEIPTLYLELIDISVGRKPLRLPSNLFKYQEGGFFIDTGAQFTVLKKEAYSKVIEELKKYYSGKLKQVNATHSSLELCYKENPSMYGSMTFHLKGADYEITNLFVGVEPGIMCIALKPGELSVLGAYHQWNKRFIFDLNNNVLKFVNYDCSKDRR